MKTYSYNINTRCNSRRRHGSTYLQEVEEVKDGVEDGAEGEVEDRHGRFEDSKEKLKMQ